MSLDGRPVWVANGAGLVLEESGQVRSGVKQTSAGRTDVGAFSVPRTVGCHGGYFYIRGGWFFTGGNQPPSVSKQLHSPSGNTVSLAFYLAILSS